MRRWNQGKKKWSENAVDKSKLKKIFLVALIIIFVVGVILGGVFYKSKSKNASKKKAETFNLTLEDMYCNIKESKKIVKVKITIETKDKKDLERIVEKQFLIRDDINKIIRNKTDVELQGKEGQVELQGEIKESLKKLFDKTNIVNVYFDDLIVQ